jgi:putative PIN family toxin of toxin-antitoxin system
VLHACIRSHEVVASEHILAEVARHLASKAKLSASHAADILAFLRGQVEIVRPATVPASACRDRDDLAILGTALAARADYLLTGDRDLLDLGEYGGIPILTPRAFHDRMRIDER